MLQVDKDVPVDARKRLRTSLCREVVIYRHGYPFAQAQMLDIGPDGIRLDTPLNAAKNTFLEVEFSLGNAPYHNLYRLPIFVGRRRNDCGEREIELLFYEFKIDELAALEQELQALNGSPQDQVA